MSVEEITFEKLNVPEFEGHMVVATDWKNCDLVDCRNGHVVESWETVEECIKGLAGGGGYSFPLVLEDRASGGTVNRRVLLRMKLGGGVQIVRDRDTISRVLENEVRGVGSLVIVSERGSDAFVYQSNGGNRSVFSNDGILHTGKKKGGGKIKSCVKWILRWAKSRKEIPPKVVEVKDADRDRGALITYESKKIRIDGTKGEYEWLE